MCEKSIDYVTVNDKMKEWGKSKSMVCKLCNSGRIGAKKFGKSWMIPKNATYPKDLRFILNRLSERNKKND